MPSHALNDTYIGSTNIYLNSKDATLSFSDAHKTFFLNNAIIPPPNVQILIGLTQFVCPNTMYNINTTNNKFVIQSNSSTATLIFDTGNYDADSIVIAMNQKLNDVKDDLGGVITVSFDDSNGVFTWTSIIDFSILATSTMVKEIGLRDQLPTPFQKSYTTTEVVDLAGTTSIYVNLKNIAINNLDSRGQVTGTVAKCSADVNFGSYIFYNPTENLYFMCSDQTINSIEVQLSDDDGDELQLNGAYFTMVLTIHYSYKREPILDEKYSLQARNSVFKKQEQEKQKTSS